MVRKGSYTVSDGPDTPDTPSGLDSRAVELNYDKADDQRARNRERNLRLLVIGLILVVILLLAAIIWLLLAHRSKPQHVSDHTTTNMYDDAQGRKAGTTTTVFTKPEEFTTTTTARTPSIIDPGKKKTTPQVTSTTRSTMTDSTTGQPDFGSRTTDKKPEYLTSTSTTSFNSSTSNREQSSITPISTRSTETHVTHGITESLTSHTTDVGGTDKALSSELTERPTQSTSTTTEAEYADDNLTEITENASGTTASASRSSESPISTTEGVEKPTTHEATASSSVTGFSSTKESREYSGSGFDVSGTDKATGIASSTTAVLTSWTEEEYADDPVEGKSEPTFLSTTENSTTDRSLSTEGDGFIDQSKSTSLSSTSTLISAGLNSSHGFEESDTTASPSISTSTTPQSTTMTEAGPDQHGSNGAGSESTTLQETASTANSTTHLQSLITEATTTESTSTLSVSSSRSSESTNKEDAATPVSASESTTELSNSSQIPEGDRHSTYNSTSASSSTDWQTQTTEGTASEATTVSETTTERRRLLRLVSQTTSEGTSKEDLATTRLESTTEDTFSSSVEVSTLPEPEPTTCWSQNCKKVAARMLTWMEHIDGEKTVPDSCPDFYRYACEGLLSAGGKIQPPEPEEETSRRIMETMNAISSSSPRPLTLFQGYYNSCLHFDAEMELDKRYSEAQKLIAEVGMFYTEQTWDGSADPTELVAKLILRHSTPLFDIMLDVSKADPAKFALRVTIPIHYSLLGHDNEAFSGQARCLEDLSKSYEPMLDLRETYDNYITCKKIPVEYLESLEEAIVRLKLLEGWDTFDRNQTRTAIRQDIEMNIFQNIDDNKPSADKIRIAILAKDYEEIPLRDMDSKFPGVVSWPKLFQILLNRTLSDDELIQVYFPDYLAKMLKSVFRGLQMKKDSRQLNNALLAMYATQVYQEMVAPPYYAMRDLHCLRAASTIMEDVASFLYLQSFSPQEMHQKEQLLKKMFEDIRATLVEEFQNQREVWHGVALQAMVNKTRQMQASVSSGREVVLDMSRLRDKYDDMPGGLSYIGQSSTLVKRYRKSMYGLYGKSALSEEVVWSHFLLPHSNYGITVYGQNRIVIPFGALHPRFYDPDLPYYLNLARLGSMIGHEMVHAFDKIGIKFSTSKTLWKMVDASTAYNNSLECLRNQPDFNKEIWTLPPSQGLKDVTYQHLSELTLNERFADLGGTYLAWKTHQRLTKRDSRNNVVLPWLGMSQDQLFFLANAQMQCSLVPLYQHSITLAEREHLPPELRVDTMAKNLEAFSNAFPCSSPAVTQCRAFPAIERNDNSAFPTTPRTTAKGRDDYY